MHGGKSPQAVLGARGRLASENAEAPFRQWHWDDPMESLEALARSRQRVLENAAARQTPA
jgi:hypothetical protein